MTAPPLRGRLDKQTLERLYWKDGLTAVTIANRYHSHSASVLQLMKRYGIERRPSGPHRQDSSAAHIRARSKH